LRLHLESWINEVVRLCHVILFKDEKGDMKLFPQRKGIKPGKNVVQVDSMDDELRNGLWNGLTAFYWE